MQSQSPTTNNMTGLLLRATSSKAVGVLPQLRRVTFELLLPCYVLRSMWTIHLNSDMFSVILISFVVHVLIATIWWFVFSRMRNRPLRGWSMMSCKGCMLSFLYASVGANPKFGPTGTATCLLWDIGGNFWLSQAALFGIASAFAPQSSKKNPLDLEKAQELLKESENASNSENIMGIIKVIVFQPILIAFLIGLGFNVYGVRCPLILDFLLSYAGSFFRPSLYLVLGLYFDFTALSDTKSLLRVVTTLFIRFTFNFAIGLFCWFLLPLGEVVRATIVLCLLSPASIMPMYLVAKFNYPTRYTSMSAFVSTLSVMISFVVQNTLMALYEPSTWAPFREFGHQK